MKRLVDCIKVYNGVECQHCSYPYSEALIPDMPGDYGGPLSCHASQEDVDEWVEEYRNQRDTVQSHYWDCKCVYCR